MSGSQRRSMSEKRGLEPLLRPLEQFTSLHAATLRRHGSHAIDLSFPNPRVRRDGRAVDLLGAVAGRLTADELQYTPLGGSTILRRKVAGVLSQMTCVPYNYRDIVFTPGGAAALATGFAALLEPGDEALVLTPGWMDYPLYLRQLGVGWQFVRYAGGSPDLAALTRAWGPRTRAVILSQPNCPTGVMLGAAELASLAEALVDVGRRDGRMPILFSDEVHRDQTWAGEFVSPVHFYDNVVSFYSLGKAWSLQGQRTGYLAISPRFQQRESVQRDAVRALRANGACAPTVVMQQVMAELAGHRPAMGSLAADQDRARQLLRSGGADVVDATATAFVYVRCPLGLTDSEFAEAAAAEGVLILPSELFHDSSHYRIALNVGGEQLDEGLRRLVRIHHVTESRGPTRGTS
ncbi:aminotransferase class I/II-fold pyridoxal phosphate-dependent enzyme [Pseudonocardia broussonetiae]|uniref:Pyridoxal phosphate-dependent aminotransferase n=1 Tax=Pseudonocardia broussonetiae TaxID=2736640 RepID=A0A6M6JG61_9PSEU|nr:pyridoxal phosphate-dependent aminotransferase [Pseudonocardia broussonetiae]QJY45732.1 pyridoxal phosphate-dependent aminotransferase [Pseudonocardia broussonetiae]